MMKKNLYILGAGTPTPTASYFGSSFVLQLGEEYLMIDCGPATTHKLVKVGLFPIQIQHLFFTHHHFDHNADYPCFLLSRWDQSKGIEKPLSVWGPTPIKQITERLIGPKGAFTIDWLSRTQSPASQAVFVERGGILPRPKPKLNVSEIKAGKVIEQINWYVTAVYAAHVGSPLISLAYRFDIGKYSIVFAGDTVRCKSVIKLAQGADALILSCWEHQKNMKPAIASVIAGTYEAARLASETNVKQLILTHFNTNLKKTGSREKARADISRYYKGNLVFGEELMCLKLSSMN